MIKKFFNKDRLDYIISRAPIMVFLAIVVLDILSSGLSEESCKHFYYMEVEFLKTGLIPSLCWLAIAFRYKLCWYNKVSIIGLIIMSITTLCFIGIGRTVDNYDFYNLVFNQILIWFVSAIVLILLIKKI